jgi:hypothetical protein
MIGIARNRSRRPAVDINIGSSLSSGLSYTPYLAARH